MPIPPTSYILNALREMYIKYADPSDMGRDLYDGLKEKERDLAMLTHETILQNIDNYEEQEEIVAKSIGSGLSELLVGTKGPDDFKLEPPSISFSDFSHYTSSSSSSSSSLDNTIHVGEYYLLVSEIYNGNIPYTNFTYEWEVVNAPVLGFVHFSELYNEISTTWKIGTIIDFTEPGLYTLQLNITHKEYTSMIIRGLVTATVEV